VEIVEQAKKHPHDENGKLIAITLTLGHTFIDVEHPDPVKDVITQSFG